jgi:3-deoxy-manno-octulosonate cytidylyltransferase (CMP-KDO synthetase)
MSFRVIIPARHASTRLPGKPLLDIAGKPMIQHVYERCKESGADSIHIATDDHRIHDVAMAFGADVVMTSAEHRSGTERLAETVQKLGCEEQDIIVNVQGDEPLMPANLIQQVADDLQTHSDANVATLCTPFHADDDVHNTNIVKVVCDRNGYALYFSRAAIPWEREAFAHDTRKPSGHYLHFRHIGLYAYRAGFLQTYVNWPECDMETMESLEQLRVLWHGEKIHVSEALTIPPPGVDTGEELERVKRLIEKNNGG